MSDLFVHNWIAQVEVETSWRTAIEEAADSVIEERWARIGKPYRSMRVLWTAVKRAEAARAVYALLSLAHRDDQEIPLYCDQSIVTVASLGTTITCDTTNRRFQVGKRVAIVANGTDGRTTVPQFRTIQALTNTTITVTVALTGTFAIGSLVYPTLYVEKVLASDLSHMTDHVGEARVDVDEVYGTTALAPFNAAPANPVDWTIEQGFPMFDDSYKPDWSSDPQVRFERAGERTQVGNGTITSLRGARPQILLTLSITVLTRRDVWYVLDFVDSRRGRLFPFWVTYTAGIWEPVTLNTGFVDIVTEGTLADVQDFFPYVAVARTDGGVYIRAVSGIVVNGANWRISFVTPLPVLDLANIRRIVPALFVRFSSDTVVEKWITDTSCRFDLNMQEVLGAEASIALAKAAL